MRRPIVTWLWLIALAFASGAPDARASQAAIAVDKLETSAGSEAASAIVGGAYADDFKPQPYAALIPSRERGAWYRIRLVEDWNGEHRPLIAVFDPSGLALTVYAPPDYQAVPRSIYGDSAPGFTRHAVVTMLPPKIAASTPIYLYVAPERAIPRRVEIRDATDYRTADLLRARLDVLFPAVQLAALLIMLAFFVALRERMYAYFSGYVLALIAFELYVFGIAYELPPLDALAPLGQRPVWCAALLTVALNIAFSRQFLALGVWVPRLDRALRWATFAYLALAACSIVPALSRGWWIEDALSVLLLVSIPLLILAAVLAWQQGARRVGLFLCAWTPALLLTVLRVLQLRMQWPLPMWLEFGLPAALAYANLVLAFVLAGQTLSIRYERDVAHRLAEHDALTGTLNRRAILARLRSAYAQARQSGEALSLLFLDLDHFKRVNDHFGHRAGDQCLRAVIAPIAQELRQGDALGRYGGEEFLVVLPGAAGKDAEVVAERIRRRVQEMPLFVSGTEIGLTISVGVATLEADVLGPDDLIERADSALYRAKSGGRNLVSTHSGEMSAVADGRIGG